jgi:hypothetical protein
VTRTRTRTRTGVIRHTGVHVLEHHLEELCGVVALDRHVQLPALLAQLLQLRLHPTRNIMSGIFLFVYFYSTKILICLCFTE